MTEKAGFSPEETEERVYSEALNILKTVKAVKPESESEAKGFLRLTVKKAILYICGFCNFKLMPPVLIPLAGEIAAGEFLEGRLSVGGLDIEGLDLSGAVKAITEGDTTVQFEGSPSGTSAAELLCGYIDKLTNRDRELVAFRRFKW